jgi:hypothetical protein
MRAVPAAIAGRNSLCLDAPEGKLAVSVVPGFAYSFAYSREPCASTDACGKRTGAAREVYHTAAKIRTACATLR